MNPRSSLAIQETVGEGADTAGSLAVSSERPPAFGVRFSVAKAAHLLELPDEAVATALLALAQREITVFERVTQTWSFAVVSLRHLALHFAELVFLAARAAAKPCPRWALDPLFFPVLIELLTELHEVTP